MNYSRIIFVRRYGVAYLSNKSYSESTFIFNHSHPPPKKMKNEIVCPRLINIPSSLVVIVRISD